MDNPVFEDLPSTKTPINANNLNKITLKRQNIPNAIGAESGWYLVGSGTLTGNNNVNLAFLVERVYTNGTSILKLNIRCNNTAELQINEFKLRKITEGFKSTNFIITTNGNNYYLYANNYVSYEIIRFTLLDESTLGYTDDNYFEFNNPISSDTVSEPNGTTADETSLEYRIGGNLSNQMWWRIGKINNWFGSLITINAWNTTGYVSTYQLRINYIDGGGIALEVVNDTTSYASPAFTQARLVYSGANCYLELLSNGALGSVQLAITIHNFEHTMCGFTPLNTVGNIESGYSTYSVDLTTSSLDTKLNGYVPTVKGDTQVTNVMLGYNNGWVLYVAAITGNAEHHFMASLTQID